MKRLLIYYNFMLVTLMTLMGFLNAQSSSQLIIASMFYPVAVYFGMLIAPKRNRALKLPNNKAAEKAVKKSKKSSSNASSSAPVANDNEKLDEPVELKRLSKEEEMDIDRRAFIKLIGSAGLSVFFLSLFTKKAQAAFFGSVPGPGTVAIKDSSGNVIDPAKNQPTDGYRVAEIDDSSDPTYYGFTNNDGAWYILQDSSGTYRYAVGSSDFSTNWTGRAGLSYSRYEDVF